VIIEVQHAYIYQDKKFLKKPLRTSNFKKWILRNYFQPSPRLAYNFDSRCANVNSMANIEFQISGDMKVLSSRLDDLEKVAQEYVQGEKKVPKSPPQGKNS
jgi:hypothetical protein